MKPFKEGRVNIDDLRKALAKGALQHPTSQQIKRDFDRLVRRNIRSLERDYPDYEYEDDWIFRDPDEGDR